MFYIGTARDYYLQQEGWIDQISFMGELNQALAFSITPRIHVVDVARTIKNLYIIIYYV